MTPFTPLLVTSLYEVFIERMEHNDTLHTSACDLSCMKYEEFIERMEHNDTLHTSACDLTV